MKTETIYVLYDPVKERYWSKGHIGRVYARGAHFFISPQTVAKQQAWWEARRFSEIIPITIVIQDPIARLEVKPRVKKDLANFEAQCALGFDK